MPLAGLQTYKDFILVDVTGKCIFENTTEQQLNDSNKITIRAPSYIFFFFFGGPWSVSLLLPESELSEEDEEEEDDGELSLSLLLSSEEELEESLLSDDESLEEESLLLPLETLALRVKVQWKKNETRKQADCCPTDSEVLYRLWLLLWLTFNLFSEKTNANPQCVRFMILLR